MTVERKRLLARVLRRLALYLTLGATQLVSRLNASANRLDPPVQVDFATGQTVLVPESHPLAQYAAETARQARLN